MMRRERLDKEIVRRGLASTRSQAAELVNTGRVMVSGVLATKSARLVSPEEPIFVSGTRPKYVSRGGVKLEAALRSFRISPHRKICLDVGASTGGFTDCLLRHGASKVYAVDVGRAQLNERLRRDPRVVSLEATDARDLNATMVPDAIEVVTVDVSFISATKVVPSLVSFAAPEAWFIVLIKPQFEAGRGKVQRGGVLRDPSVHREVLKRVIERLEAEGLCLVGLRCSPIPGASGNIEYLSAWKLDQK